MPTITLIEVDVAIQEIKTIIDQVSQAIELVLVIILVAGALVLIAGVSSSVDERLHESAILRALGAGRATLMGAVAIEFAAMGALAGVLAIMGSEAAGWVLQTQMLELDYQIQWLLWPLGIILGSLIIGIGTYACRRVVSAPPLQVLRDFEGIPGNASRFGGDNEHRTGGEVPSLVAHHGGLVADHGRTLNLVALRNSRLNSVAQ